MENAQEQIKSYAWTIMNFEQGSNIKFCFKLQKSAEEAHEMLK